MSTLSLYSPRRKKISLTALIDVVFILLMFFMLTSSFTKWNAIELTSPSADTSNTSNQTQFVFLAADSSITLLGGAFTLSHVQLFNNTHAQEFTRSPVVLIPEASVSVQTIIGAIESLKASGLNNVTLGNSKAINKTETNSKITRQ